MAKQFGSPVAFKASLEAHLRARSGKTGQPFSTLQTRFVIERLLARLFRDSLSPWLLKGGYAMDLRYRPQARTTKDVDLTILKVQSRKAPDSDEATRDQLQEAADCDLGDFLSYRIGEAKKEITNAPGGGVRYPCEAFILGKTYQKLSIDVGYGDALFGSPERLIGEDFLDFAGVGPAIVLAIPKSQQFAEKAHAYSFPWEGRVNTRTKDLVDLVLMIERAHLDLDELRTALGATFENRKSHPLPEILQPPPDSWAIDFQGMAEEAGLSTTDYQAAYTILKNFWSAYSLGGPTRK